MRSLTSLRSKAEDDEVSLGAVELGDAGEMRPPLEAEATEEREARLVGAEGARGQGLYAERGSAFYGLLQQTSAYPFSPVALPDVDADLGRPVVGRPGIVEVAEAEPAYHYSSCFGDPDRTPRRVVLVEPGQPLLDGDGLGVGRDYPARDGGVVDLHDGREIFERGVAQSYFHVSSSAQRSMAALQSSNPGTRAILMYPAPPDPKALPGATIIPSSISRSA